MKMQEVILLVETIKAVTVQCPRISHFTVSDQLACSTRVALYKQNSDWRRK